MTKRRIRQDPRPYWTPAEDDILRASYADTRNVDLLAQLPGRSIGAIYQRAAKLGLAKSAAFLASTLSGRMRAGEALGAAHRFRPGQAPANKGLRRPGWAPGRMRETQFRKGERNGVAARNYKPIGSERISADGYLERKINNDLPMHRRWRAVHLLVWEATHGPLPPGHAVWFLNGDKSDIRLENLTLITRAEAMRRNTLHNLPEPLPQLIQLRAALVRRINNQTRETAHAE